ncbi:MAG TPA: UDP-N-acetylmuramoyl-L-alanine--D-glutamate ligase [Thermoanaerobaculia bacterium]|nr:UDP-N-acetylmuramoyl-L-alanine--D-glutamate ligase [Thermoanaerobaculia bacterium]
MTTTSVLPPKIAVLGFARSGRALAEALAARGVSVVVGDRRPEAEFEGLDALRARGIRFDFGGPSAAFLEGADWLAVSPGVPLDEATVRAARRRALPVLAEIEVAFRIAEAEAPGRHRWIAVTGTNGKSTTTSWIAEILKRAGRPAVLAGNIGAPLSGFLDEASPRDFVCEVSSFQLEAIERFRPHVAVLTNVTPDHLDRYADFAAYAAAKARVFERQEAGDFAVVNADDATARSVATRARRVLFSRGARPKGAGGAAWVEAGKLQCDVAAPKHAVVAADRLALPGAHNLENALAALAAAECLATPAEAIVAALTRFEGLPHRTQLVAEARGVRWVDDSKGTNVDATAKSLEGRAPASVLLILGGRDKHGDFAALRQAVRSTARAVLTIGEAAPAIERALEGVSRLESCGTMGEAVARAARLARPGDTVLLSPACASFDQYKNFEERGRHFAALARKATEERHGP